MMMNVPVLVLNASYEYLNVTTLRRAVMLLCKQKAQVVSTIEGLAYRSAEKAYNLPSVIRMKYYVRKPFRDVVLSRRNILDRDNHTCQYCGEPGDTIDHIEPRSKGGVNSWTNLVCCCAPCNKKKANQTLEESGMELLHPPRRPSAIPWLRHQKVRTREDWHPYLYM